MACTDGEEDIVGNWRKRWGKVTYGLILWHAIYKAVEIAGKEP